MNRIWVEDIPMDLIDGMWWVNHVPHEQREEAESYAKVLLKMRANKLIL